MVSISRRWVLGGRRGADVVPFEALGAVVDGAIRTGLGAFGVAECDDELVAFFEGAG